MGSIQTVMIGTATYSVYSITSNPLQDLKDYFNARLGAAAAAVQAATDDDLKRSMVMSADFIDRVTEFSGKETVNGQPREFPRDGAMCDDTPVPDGTTPDDIAKAQFEVSGLFLQDQSLYDSTGTGSNVRRVGAGTAQVEFFMPTMNNPLQDSRLPPAAFDILKCYFDGAGSDEFGSTASGTDIDPFFGPNDFDRWRAF